MEIAISFISYLIILTGFIFLFISIIGLFRIDNPTTKIHSASISDSLAIPLILIGLSIKIGMNLVSLKMIILFFIIIIIAPVVTHNIARISYKLTYKRDEND